MTDDRDLIERVANAMMSNIIEVEFLTTLNDAAKAIITTLRAYDREQRAKIDVAIAPKSDPDDYRDLPLAMTGTVRFEGGLTTEKRK